MSKASRLQRRARLEATAKTMQAERRLRAFAGAEAVFVREASEFEEEWTREGVTLLLPTLRDDYDDQLRDGVACWRAAMLTGQCPECHGMAGIERATNARRREVVARFTVRHAPGCPASSDLLTPKLTEAIRRVRTHLTTDNTAKDDAR